MKIISSIKIFQACFLYSYIKKIHLFISRLEMTEILYKFSKYVNNIKVTPCQLESLRMHKGEVHTTFDFLM